MLTRTSKQLVSEANAVVESLSPEDAARLVGALTCNLLTSESRGGRENGPRR
jgi:hypothetical protein